jgi:hypothetical protein
VIVDEHAHDRGHIRPPCSQACRLLSEEKNITSSIRTIDQDQTL